MNKLLQISEPYIVRLNGVSRLCADVYTSDINDMLYFEVPNNYTHWLAKDTSDAFLAFLLPWAMRNNYNLAFDGPISKRLLYQVRDYLIPTMAKNLDGYSSIRILAQTTTVKYANNNHVVLPFTAGVDSMFTLLKNQYDDVPYKIDTLIQTANGALEKDDVVSELMVMHNRIKSGIGTDLGMNSFFVNTNLQDFDSVSFLSVSAFRHAACALALAKGAKLFLISSAYGYDKFSFDINNVFYYEHYLLPMLSTNYMTLLCAYGGFKRIDKITYLIDKPLAQKYLHPCVHADIDTNCGLCGKCKRTLLVLDALDALDAFKDVFDLGEYKRNKDYILAEAVANKTNEHYAEALIAYVDSNKKISESTFRKSRMLEAAKNIVDAHKQFLKEQLDV